jgi:acetolactate synthase I/II/III large subunit
MNGAQSLFKALVDAGITTCFANPGTSEMQLVYEIGMTDKVRPVLCLQEDVVTGAADGYARMKGAPAFTLLHVGSGFANGVAMLHNAGRANTPIVNVVGANASYHQPNYPEHELINGRVADLARTVSYWSQEARSASNLGELGAEAAALAKTGKICTVIAPTNWHWEEANPPPIVPASPGRPEDRHRGDCACRDHAQERQEDRSRAGQPRPAGRGADVSGTHRRQIRRGSARSPSR